MLAIELSFPAGRYHATPWDRHVNEGAVEWPPSPWRILRALIANWHLKARPGDRMAEADLVAVVHALAGELPGYRLPPTTIAHTRHYMPRAGGSDKILDTFVQLPRNEKVTAIWPSVELDERQRGHLDLLLRRMSYLGRAESLVEARLGSESGIETNCVVHDGSECNDLVSVLAPMHPDSFASWRDGALEQRTADKLRAKAARSKKAFRVRLTAKEQRDVDSALPATIYAALGAETGLVKKQGWTRPPGSRWVGYRRSCQLASVSTTRRRSRRARSLPTVARYAVASQVPPRLTDALLLTERVHQSLVKHSGGLPVFTGRAADDRMQTGHAHAFILPEAHLSGGRISHITICAESGFDERSRAALEKLRRLWSRIAGAQLVLIGLGGRKSFAGHDLRAGRCPLLVEATTWESYMPFVPTRHPKQFRDGRPKLDRTGLQIGSPEHDLRRLLRENGYPEPVTVEPLAETVVGGKPTRWAAFRTRRSTGGGRRVVTGSGCGFRIFFPVPVAGPVAIGYGAHFGLGVFTPVVEL